MVCIEDGKLLKKFEYEILFNAGGLHAALYELNGINYFRTYINADELNYNELLDGLMGVTFSLMAEIAPDPLIYRIFALYYDIHNIKLAVKERFINRRFDDVFLDYGYYTLPTIRSATVRESDDILQNEILTTGLFTALRSKDMYDCDFILDKTYLKCLKAFAAQMGVPSILSFVIERIDLYNVSAYFQHTAVGSPEEYFKKTFSDQGSYPYEEWSRYTESGDMEAARKFPLWQKYRPVWQNAESRRMLFEEIDVLIDNYLIERTKACKLIAFGVEPICAYFYNKFMEIKNIRILLTGKENGYETGEIIRRMRIPYEL